MQTKQWLEEGTIVIFEMKFFSNVDSQSINRRNALCSLVFSLRISREINVLLNNFVVECILNRHALLFVQ